ncbi:hypothetical protein [Actinomadura alba]|uniref:Uncharacterized protein n=1 Tax=Actinomadura alba TaxID=406431 RepID=A0ABR7LTJ8_9ACTN|nr:hypothetical protein [Actinomadura alba]MBC6468173.1 hypothetical protein [Actinomadura alba]
MQAGRHARPASQHAVELRALTRRFPGVPLWWGHATGNWWALVGGRLVEADTSEELGRVITAARVHHAMRTRSVAWREPSC